MYLLVESHIYSDHDRLEFVCFNSINPYWFVYDFVAGSE